MSSPFTITAASAMILLDANRQAQMVFTFSNISGRAIRGRVQIVPQNITMVPWLSLMGPAERDFPMASTQQYTIEIRVPPSAAPGSYTFRLDAVSIENPDEEYTEGPSVTFTVPAPTPVVHSFSWKIPVAVLLVLAVLILGITVWPDGIFPPPKTPTLPVTIPPTIMQPTLPPSPVARPDLLLGDIRIERNPNDSYYKDMMIATLINQGTGEARGSAWALRIAARPVIPPYLPASTSSNTVTSQPRVVSRINQHFTMRASAVHPG